MNKIIVLIVLLHFVFAFHAFNILYKKQLEIFDKVNKMEKELYIDTIPLPSITDKDYYKEEK
jgi:hypothetical protein